MSVCVCECAVSSIERRLAHKTQVACFDDDHQARLIAGNQMFLYSKLLGRGRRVAGTIEGSVLRAERGSCGLAKTDTRKNAFKWLFN